jgi:hypothetical protein
MSTVTTEVRCSRKDQGLWETGELGEPWLLSTLKDPKLLVSSLSIKKNVIIYLKITEKMSQEDTTMVILKLKKMV